MIEQIIYSAASGFGASFGRDLYKAAKKNPLILVVVGAALIAVGWRGFYMGVGRSGAYKFFVTFLGSLVMVIIGTVAFLLMAAVVDDGQNSDVPMIAIIIILVFTVVGNVWGYTSRTKRKKAIDIEKSNVTFLRSIGIKDSEFDSNLLEDSNGNLLKLIDQTDDKIVFSISGRRNLRAAIYLANGYMKDYTGVVKI